MELRDALTQIAEIRQQMARGEVFRGYRAATTAFSAVVALAASGVQEFVLSPEDQNSWHMLYLWLAAAVLSLLAAVTIRISRRMVRKSRGLPVAGLPWRTPTEGADLQAPT